MWIVRDVLQRTQNKSIFPFSILQLFEKNFLNNISGRCNVKIKLNFYLNIKEKPACMAGSAGPLFVHFIEQ